MTQTTPLFREAGRRRKLHGFRGLGSGLGLGIALGFAVALGLSGALGLVGDSERSSAPGGSAPLLAGIFPGPGSVSALLGEAKQDLGSGDYLFLPNRRTVWVVNRKVGRFANYHFRNDQQGTVIRSRVVTLNPRDFPPRDTLYLLSDRNLTEVLWVANRRTGDVQLWVPRADGNIVSDGQVVTSMDLQPR